VLKLALVAGNEGIQAAQRARALLTMPGDELRALPLPPALQGLVAGLRICDLRLAHADVALGTHGVETLYPTVTDPARFAQRVALYLNAGDTYVPTLIYFGGRYRVQSIGDFVEVQDRRGIKFN
jgi:hypothetical protein